jgi:phage terminase large subunit-like protein
MKAVKLKKYDPYDCDLSKYYYDPVAGQVAVDFIEGYITHVKGELGEKPFLLLDWEKEFVSNLFGWKVKETGLRRYREAFVFVPRKQGKALQVDTPILTTEGWKRHGDLVPGDYVFSPDGLPVEVKYVTPHYEGKCYYVDFSGDEVIIAHENHEWKTNRRHFTGKPRRMRSEKPLVTTKQISKTLRVGKRQDLVHSVDVAKPLQFHSQEYDIPPYVLGVWLGDGNSGDARITIAEQEIIDKLAEYGYAAEYRSRYLHLVGRGKFQKQLRQENLLHNKHIPEKYLRGSVEQRLELLRGLMDTDGYISKDGQCEIVQMNPRLFDQIVELITGLGLKPRVSIDRAQVNGKDCGARLRVHFFAYKDMPISYIQKKFERQKDVPFTTQRSQHRMISNVLPAGIQTVNCITVEGGMYLAGKSLIPTHNSPLGAAIALYLLIVDNEPGAELISIAADREQARAIFDTARFMVKQNSKLNELVNAYHNAILAKDGASVYKVVSSDVGGKHGGNLHAALFDELHTQKDRELYDVIQTSFGARRQPLLISFSTAGYDRESICYEVYETARQVSEGLIRRDWFYPVIFQAEPEDDWTSEEVWKKANPSLGHTVKIDYLRQEFQKALSSPAYQNTFKRLYLNMWTSQETRWIDMAAWDACGKVEINPELLQGSIAYGGLDLASVSDIAAFVLDIPNEPGEEECHTWLPTFFVPEARINDPGFKDRDIYQAWVDQGYMIATPGNVIDYDYIINEIERLGELYNIKEIAFDRWGATQISQTLTKMGFTLIGFGQGFVSMSPPTKEVERLVLQGKIRHGNNPVMRWMMDNVMIVTDAAGNIKIDKKKSRQKVDGVIAGVMATDRAVRHSVEANKSIYESRGLVML